MHKEEAGGEKVEMESVGRSVGGRRQEGDRGMGLLPSFLSFLGMEVAAVAEEEEEEEDPPGEGRGS